MVSRRSSSVCLLQLQLHACLNICQVVCTNRSSFNKFQVDQDEYFFFMCRGRLVILLRRCCFWSYARFETVKATACYACYDARSWLDSLDRTITVLGAGWFRFCVGSFRENFDEGKRWRENVEWSSIWS